MYTKFNETLAFKECQLIINIKDLPRHKICITSKVTVDHVHTMKAYKGSRGIAPPIRNLELDGDEWSTSRPGRFTARKEPQYTLDRGLCGPQSRSARFGDEKTLLPLPDFESWVVQPVV
jgi:hypothetical protein